MVDACKFKLGLFPEGIHPYRAMMAPHDHPHTLNTVQFEEWCDAVRDTIASQGMSNDFEVYERLIDDLVAQPNVAIVPLAELCASENKRTRVALRHDIDAGIASAPIMANMLKSRGLPGAFYVLHTSAYYGFFSRDDKERNIFMRQPACVPYLHELIGSGRDVGIHNDALTVFFEQSVDGIGALRAELRWLRYLGAEAHGTTAHNSASLYGAENFQVFSDFAQKAARRLTFQDVSIPLGTTSMKKLGLAYEGNLPRMQVGSKGKVSRDGDIRNADWLAHHFLNNPIFASRYDVDIWMVGRDGWFIASREPDPELRFPATTEEVMAFIAQDRAGRTIVLNIHPDYFA